MKILHVTQGYKPAIGGTEFLYQKISETLVQDYGDDVTVFTTNCYNGEAFWNPKLARMETGWSELNGVKIYRFPVRSRVSQSLRPVQKLFHMLKLPYHDWMRTYFGGPIIPGLQNAIKKFPADVVAASSFPLLHMFDALAACQASHKPLVMQGNIHPQDKWGFHRDNIYRAIQQCDGYLANTDYEFPFLESRGVPRSLIRVVGAGVTPSEFEGISTADARQRLGLPQDKPVIGFIGQIGNHKGIDTLMKAMPCVWESLPEVHLVIAGGRAMFAEKLDDIISAWPEEFRQRLHLFYNFPEGDKPYLFNALDVFTYPSGFESFGIAYVEAWASKKPVIGTWSGAIPWVVSAGRDGLLVNFGFRDQLAEAILLMIKYPEWARSMGEAGYQKVQRQYTWHQVAKRVREGYEAGIQRKARKSIGGGE